MTLDEAIIHAENEVWKNSKEFVRDLLEEFDRQTEREGE